MKIYAGNLHRINTLINIDVYTTYSAQGEPTKTVEQSYRDTWLALKLGATHLINQNTYVYGSVEKDFGGDFHMDWRADLGIRFSF